jgi:hypothetical protein
MPIVVKLMIQIGYDGLYLHLHILTTISWLNTLKRLVYLTTFGIIIWGRQVNTSLPADLNQIKFNLF